MNRLKLVQIKKKIFQAKILYVMNIQTLQFYTCPETYIENMLMFSSTSNAYGTFWNLHIENN